MKKISLQKTIGFSIITLLSVQTAYVNAEQNSRFRPLNANPTPIQKKSSPPVVIQQRTTRPMVQSRRQQMPVRRTMRQPQYRMPPQGYRPPMYGNGYPPPNWRPRNNNNFFGNNFFGNRGNRFFRGNWINFSDPKGTMERGWDEALDAPSQMGTMPGGWNAPSISVPNPIEVGDQFKDAAQDLPNQIQNMQN